MLSFTSPLGPLPPPPRLVWCCTLPLLGGNGGVPPEANQVTETDVIQLNDQKSNSKSHVAPPYRKMKKTTPPERREERKQHHSEICMTIQGH